MIKPCQLFGGARRLDKEGVAFTFLDQKINGLQESRGPDLCVGDAKCLKSLTSKSLVPLPVLLFLSERSISGVVIPWLQDKAAPVGKRNHKINTLSSERSAVISA